MRWRSEIEFSIVEDSLQMRVLELGDHFVKVRWSVCEIWYHDELTIKRSKIGLMYRSGLLPETQPFRRYSEARWRRSLNY